MPRFAILDHDHPVQHWDFLLEAGDVLRAWRLASEPVCGQTIAAAALPDHRRTYLEFEGPVSGSRGRVIRWDAGTFEWLHDSEHEVRIWLVGERISGMVTLRRTAGRWEWFCA